MSDRHPTMMEPPVEDLLDKVDSKFTLVSLAAMRGRQINSYFNQLGEGLGTIVPPQVTSVSRKPLSISLEEIAAGKITYHRIDARRRPSRRRAVVGGGGRAITDGDAEPWPAGAIVLGVSGGIAAYKAVEVCRRLIDAGADVSPVHDRGGHPVRRRRSTSAPRPPSRCARRCGTRPSPSPIRSSGQGADLVIVAPATARADRRLRRWHLQRPVDRHPAGHPGAGPGLPGHAHRDVGAPGRADNLACCAGRGVARRWRPARAAWRAATAAPAGWPNPAEIVAAAAARLPGRPGPGGSGRAPRPGHRRGDPRSPSTPCATSATGRRASRATPSPPSWPPPGAPP